MEQPTKALSKKEKRAEARVMAPPMKRGRVAAYYLCLVALNVLLGFYALYAFGLVLRYDWSITGAAISVFETVLMVLLAFSPVLITVLVNRVLYLVFRRRLRFPRGTVIWTLLIIIVAQAITMWLTLLLGAGDPSRSMSVTEYVSFFVDLVS